ncbi:SymE family type I addiction module toxin [Cellvibrio japonicus]|uniref:Toxin SymE-like domain-containing protein n=1 Tax=Cellvibrio japonicus (strain Ueda107) TaxID=498211 RepID=B3PKZ7_CELJU|nr:SymE family type I addiction module toxin [Cellvibrio japonicus]ACE83669.1 hypothetical protein CJA_2510 [Cellvibrio japonicus Ueda107]QEI12895.1 type I addiction module toxin, SymE family [Cellvibrio japonicus]QEI16469.1 type I addiction module toxin, SymE family [Cellvibrio japonicus]QEI20047.1 type I addiction module toxin, SymE family [Cellvibrio japonicus]
MAKRNDKPEPRSTAKFPYHRQLKVREGYYDYQFHSPTFRQKSCPRFVPFILLKGYWLEQANLPIGTELHVTVNPGHIILSASSGG